MNKTHWTIMLGNASQSYLKAINHKFETWEQIKFSAGTSPEIQALGQGELAESPPPNLFIGSKAHDLGSILLTKDNVDQDDSI